jgi:hypothetical protein
MRAPSSGGRGMMLNTAISTFVRTQMNRRSASGPPASTPKGSTGADRSRRPMAAGAARIRLVTGPISAIQIWSRSGRRRFDRSIGIGLA